MDIDNNFIASKTARSCLGLIKNFTVLKYFKTYRERRIYYLKSIYLYSYICDFRLIHVGHKTFFFNCKLECNRSLGRIVSILTQRLRNKASTVVLDLQLLFKESIM